MLTGTPSVPMQVVPGIESLTSNSVCFEGGQTKKFDAVILATGYRSNVPRWLKVIFPDFGWKVLSRCA